MAGDDVIEVVMPSYYAVIPAKVRYCEYLKPNEKLLYGEITALCNKTGECWASNQYFSRLFGVSTTSISKWVNSLKSEGFIHVHMIRNPVTKVIEKRVITVADLLEEKFNTPITKVQGGIEEKLNKGIEEKFKENNTSNINNPSINNNKATLTLGEFKNVRLTYEQLDTLKDRFVDWQTRIENLSAYKAQTGRRYKNDYATILVWARKEENVPKKEEKKGDMYDGF